MKRLEIILGIGCFIFVILCVVMIFFNVRLTQERIDPKECPSTRGTYGITPKVSYKRGNNLAILQKCGKGDENCATTARSPSEVIDYCNSLAHLCDAVVWSSGTSLAYIVDTTATKTDDPSFDLFEPQIFTPSTITK